MFEFIKNFFRKKEVKSEPFKIKSPKKDDFDFTGKNPKIPESQSFGRGQRIPARPIITPYEVKKPGNKAYTSRPKPVEKSTPVEDTTASDILMTAIIIETLTNREGSTRSSAPEEFKGGGGDFSGAGASGSWDDNISSSSSSSED